MYFFSAFSEPIKDLWSRCFVTVSPSLLKLQMEIFTLYLYLHGNRNLNVFTQVTQELLNKSVCSDDKFSFSTIILSVFLFVHAFTSSCLSGDTDIQGKSASGSYFGPVVNIDW